MQYPYYKSLLRRLPTSHPLYIDCVEELQKIEAGIFGEERVSRELLDLPEQIIWLSNFQCYSPQNTPHQIDFLILTPHFALILEVKNMTGTLKYQTVGKQFIRTRADGQIDIFKSPFDQAFRHQQLLEQLFKMWKIELPVTYAVIMTNPNALITDSFGTLPIFSITYLRKYLHDLKKHFPLKKVNLKSLQRKLENYACILPPRQRVNPTEILPGILCSSCLNEMTYVYGNSVCNACGKHSRTALLETLRDYYLLVNTEISSKELQNFAKLRSRYQAQFFLKNIASEKIGNSRNSKYKLPPTLLNIPF